MTQFISREGKAYNTEQSDFPTDFTELRANLLIAKTLMLVIILSYLHVEIGMHRDKKTNVT